jgi:hypothetical protein
MTRLLPPRAGVAREPLARRDGPRRAAIEGQRLDEALHGERVLERLVDEAPAELRVLDGEGAPLRPRVARGVEEALRLAEAAECDEARDRATARFGERGVEPVRPRVLERSAVPAPELLLLEPAEPFREPRRLDRLRRGRGEPLERRGRPGEVAALLEQLDDGAERRGVGGVDAEHLRVELLGPRDVPELGVGEACRLREERCARLGRDAGAPLVERDQILPTGRALVERLESLEGPEIPRSDFERLEMRTDLLVEGGSAQDGVTRREWGISADALGV